MQLLVLFLFGAWLAIRFGEVLYHHRGLALLHVLVELVPRQRVGQQHFLQHLIQLASIRRGTLFRQLRSRSWRVSPTLSSSLNLSSWVRSCILFSSGYCSTYVSSRADTLASLPMNSSFTLKDEYSFSSRMGEGLCRYLGTGGLGTSAA
jgi:hypothetical protein